MRVMVTGISGFVGGTVAARLLTEGKTVVGLSRRPAGVGVVSEQALFDISVPDVAAQIVRQLQPCEAIVHAAASLEKELFAPSVPLTNCLGTQEILKLAAAWGSYVVFTSSVPVIGRPRQLPITEEDTTFPPSAYHASKLYGEHLVRLAAGLGVVCATLRLTAPIGPGMPMNRILPVCIRPAMSGKPILLAGRGTRRQDYVDARDIAIAVEQCLAIRVSGTYNVAAGLPISNEELAHKCVSVLESESTIGFGGRRDPEAGWDWNVSIDRAPQGFGYEPRFTLNRSIEALDAEFARGNNHIYSCEL